jgi:hypothetical protein
MPQKNTVLCVAAVGQCICLTFTLVPSVLNATTLPSMLLDAKSPASIGCHATCMQQQQ